MKIKIAIADDDEIFRQSIIRTVECEDDLEIILEATDGLQLIEQLKNVMPDVILMDINMPVVDGMQATKEIIAKYPHSKIIALSGYSFDENIAEMFEKGVKGFLVKGCDGFELMRAIHEVNNAGNYVTNRSLAALRLYLKNSLDFQKAENQSAKQPDLIKLSTTELKILWHTTCLKPVKQIAAEINVSPNTVNNHQYSIRKKLSLKGGRALIKFGLSVKSQLKKMVEVNLRMK